MDSKMLPYLIILHFGIILHTMDNISSVSITNRYPTRADILDASNLAGNISEPTLRYIVEGQLLYCPSEPVCNNLTRSVFPGDDEYLSCCGGHSWDADIGDQCSNDNTIVLNDNTSCVIPQYITYGNTKINSGVAYIMISKCDSNYNDQIIVNQCNLENEDVDLFNLPLFIPVSTKNNSSVYKNRFCAFCNHVTEEDVVDWNMHVQSVTGSPFVTSPSTLNDLLQQIQSSDLSNILFFPPDRHVTSCEIIFTSCNQTGRWNSYDAIIEQGCNIYTSSYLKRYKNVFCYMCNENKGPLMGCRKTDFDEELGSIFGAFTGLIRYRNPVTVSIDQPCSVEEFYDTYTDTCRKVYCPDFYSYNRPDSSCVSMFTTMSNIMYDVYYKVNISTSLNCQLITCYEFIDGVRNAVIDKITSELYRIDHCSNSAWYIPKFNMSSPAEYAILQFRFAKIFAHDHKHFIDTFTSLSTINVSYNHIYELFTVELQSPIKIDMDTSLEMQPFLPQLTGIHPSCMFFGLTSVSVVEDYFSPRIGFSITEVSMVGGKVNILGYTDNNTNSVIGNTTYFLIDVNRYALHKRNDFINQTATEDPDDNIIEEILSAVCSFISIACLILTLIVYLLFTELQTIPGINTMILCGNLILAHALYMFGLNATGNDNICVLIGLLIHFLWVSSIMWMHICSIHMFRVFYFMNHRHGERQSKRIILLYCGYALLVSCICVCINVIEYFLKSEDDVGYLGYGGRYCYITTPYMVLFSFTLPVGLLLLSNVVMFLIVVFKIENLPEVNSDNIKSQNRNSLIIYSKLTCLTGASWVFGFIYQWTLIKAFSYIFILLNASQGLFIFLSFGCNNRVRKLCYSRVIVRKTLQSSTSSTSETKF